MGARVLLLLLLASSCRCGAPPKPAPVASSAAGPSALVPQLDETLAVLTHDESGCTLSRVNPVASRKAVVARLDGSCDTARVAFDPSGRHVALAIGRSADDGAMEFQVIEASLADGSTRTLAAPSVGELDDLGYDISGTLYALTLAVSPDPDAKALAYEGQTFAMPEDAEGQPALAHAFALDASGWRHLDVRATTVGWDESAGSGALAVWKTLGPRSTTMVDEHPAGTVVDDEALVGRLDAACTGVEDDGSWLRLAGQDPPLYLYEISGEDVDTTACVARDKGDDAEALPEANRADDLTGVFANRTYLLVGSFAQQPALLYALSTRALAARVPGDLVVFWPPP